MSMEYEDNMIYTADDIFSDDEPNLEDFKMLSKFVRAYRDFDKLHLVPNVNTQESWEYIIKMLDELDNIKNIDAKRECLYRWVSDNDDNEMFLSRVFKRYQNK